MLTLFFRLFQQKRNKSDFFVKEIFLDSGLRNLKVIYDRTGMTHAIWELFKYPKGHTERSDARRANHE
jgi:hypothetical protein